MKNILLDKYHYFQEHSDDYRRYFKSRVTRRKFMALIIGLTILLIVSLQKTIGVYSQSPESQVYHLSHVKSVLNEYNNSNRLHDKAQGPATCLIIIRSADGALGNRMFLFASAYGVARLHQCQLYVAPWILNDLRSVFQINLNQTKVQLTTNDSVVINRTDIYGRYSACTLYDDLFRIPLNTTFKKYEMIGFYQAYGYFEKYREEVNFLFQFHWETINKNVVFVEKLLKAVWNVPLDLKNYTKDNVPHSYLKSLLINPPARLTPVTWIGIHIRRGDFLSFFRIDTSAEYLTWAMNYYRRKYLNCRFIIASDDKDYVNKTLGNNTDIFITPSTFFSGHDLAALAFCDHTIVTAGTYGWWAAWLTGGDVVHDLNYPVPFQNCIKEHYFPPWFLFPHNSSSLRWKPANRKK